MRVAVRLQSVVPQLESRCGGSAMPLAGRVIRIPLNVVLGKEGLNHGGGGEKDIAKLKPEGAEGLLDSDRLPSDVRSLT